MPNVSTRALFGRRFARRLARLVKTYWASPDAPKGALLLATTIALELGTVYANVQISVAQRGIFDAFQNRQMSDFFHAASVFLIVALSFVLVSTYRIYVRQVLEIRWRAWLTDHFLREWMNTGAYCQMELHHKKTDNPDQRIAEDVRNFVASALGLSLSFLSSLAALVSFAGILWGLSEHWTYDLSGQPVHIPGVMMWAAVLYALATSWITHRVGRRLVPIQYDRERFEADFRFGLVRFRENVEPIALSQGEESQRRVSSARFLSIIANWWELIRAQRNLTLVTTGIGQANSLVPYLVAAPAFFAGHLSLGSVVQGNFAYGQVSGALTWFVNAYQEIAQWRASTERLFTFTDEIDATCAELRGSQLRTGPLTDSALRLDHVSLDRPDGKVLVEDVSLAIPRGERIALLGPSGAGKRTLLRAIAGIWPFGHGRIELPERSRTAFLSASPFLPIGTLRDVLTYPAPDGTFADSQIREALSLFGLESLATRLDEVAHWEQLLSGGEEQRLAFARALLHRPDWIFLDGATSSLDEESEARMYEVLRERLPQSAVVSIADRPSIARHHDRRLRLAEGTGRGMVLQPA